MLKEVDTEDMNGYWVLLHKTENSGNLGAVARCAAVFGAEGIVLVDPLCSNLSADARSQAKAGFPLLLNAKKYNSLKEAREHFTYIIGTTAIEGAYHSLSRTVWSVTDIKKLNISREERIAIAFGPESTGFRNKELELFDLLVKIPTNPVHTTLNLSHAVAIVLYELFVVERGEEKRVMSSRAARDRLFTTFATIVTKLPEEKRPIKEELLTVFESIINRSRLSAKEVSCLIGGMKKIGEEIDPNFDEKDRIEWEQRKEA